MQRNHNMKARVDEGGTLEHFEAENENVVTGCGVEERKLKKHKAFINTKVKHLMSDLRRDEFSGEENRAMRSFINGYSD